jgi:hypothetical protein
MSIYEDHYDFSRSKESVPYRLNVSGMQREPVFYRSEPPLLSSETEYAQRRFCFRCFAAGTKYGVSNALKKVTNIMISMFQGSAQKQA